jgi:hypothetical protein
MTLPGREAPSTQKRIDVEANLLQDWLQERRELRKQLHIRLTAIAVIAVVGGASIVKLNAQRTALAAEVKPLEKRLKVLNQDYAELAPAASAGESEAEIVKTTALTQSYGQRFLGEMIALMNNSSGSMALSSFKQDVLGGEVKQSGQADAENYLSANDFIQRNNDPAKHSNAVLVSTSRSDVLANDGVSFQFVKKVRISQ